MSRSEPKWVRWVTIPVAAIILSCAFGPPARAVVLALIGASSALFEWAKLDYWHRAVGTGIVAVFAGLLFAMRSKARWQYGVLECAFAVAVLWYLTGPTTLTKEGGFAAGMSAVYVIVRGLDNLVSGIRDSGKPPTSSPPTIEKPGDQETT